MHRELKKYLKANIGGLGNQAYWPSLIPPFEFRWNSRKRKTLGNLSPFQLVKYTEPELSIERLLSPYGPRAIPRHAREFHSNRAREMFERRQRAANAKFGKALIFQERQDYNDTTRQPRIYRKGDLVLRQEKYIGSKSKGTSTSLFAQWSGPHEIMKRVANTNIYVVKFASGRQDRVPEELL